MNATELLTRIRELAAFAEGPYSARDGRELADLVRELDGLASTGADWPRQWAAPPRVGGEQQAAGVGAFLGGVLGAVLAREMDEEEAEDRLPPRRGRRRRS